MANPWFESVAVAQRRARRTLPRSVYNAIIAGSERGTTLYDNVAAFGELGFSPHVAEAPAQRDLSATVMGPQLALPVLISPTGVQAVHPDGEVAVARAAAARGTAIGLQLVRIKAGRGGRRRQPADVLSDLLVRHARAAHRAPGARQGGRRQRADRDARLAVLARTRLGKPEIPDKLDLKTMLSFAPETIIRPRWLLAWARSGGPPPLTVPNMTIKGEDPPTFFAAYGEWMQTPPPTWDDLRWLIDWWDGPVMIKGIARVDNARRAVDAGATAISVSNHGGNNLDGQPASIRTLPGIVEAVGGEIEIVLDSGVRRGSDTVKAIALGARATMIGRAYLWGLAANGEAGVENVLDIFSGGIDSSLRGLGRASLAELEPADVLLPEGFVRTVAPAT